MTVTVTVVISYCLYVSYFLTYFIKIWSPMWWFLHEFTVTVIELNWTVVCIVILDRWAPNNVLLSLSLIFASEDWTKEIHIPVQQCLVGVGSSMISRLRLPCLSFPILGSHLWGSYSFLAPPYELWNFYNFLPVGCTIELLI